jgi:hypothetical protein
MTGDDHQDGSEPNPIVRAWDLLKSDIDTQQIQEVIHFEDGSPKINPAKAKKLAKEQNLRAIQGATAGAIIGAIISVSGVLTIPLAAAGAALGYAIDKNAVDNVEELEEDFEEVLEAVEREEEVDLSRLAMITHIKKETLSTDYLPYLDEQGFVEYDPDSEEARYSKSVFQQAIAYF